MIGESWVMIGRLRYTHATLPVEPCSAMSCFMLLWKTWQYGQLKSEYSMRITGASGLPMMWSVAGSKGAMESSVAANCGRLSPVPRMFLKVPFDERIEAAMAIPAITMAIGIAMLARFGSGASVATPAISASSGRCSCVVCSIVASVARVRYTVHHDSTTGNILWYRARAYGVPARFFVGTPCTPSCIEWLYWRGGIYVFYCVSYCNRASGGCVF